MKYNFSLTAPGVQAETSQSLYSKASLATRTQSLHSLAEPKPPAPPPPVAAPPPTTAELYEEKPVWRTKSVSQLDSDEVSLAYSEFPHPQYPHKYHHQYHHHHRPPPPPPPPWSDLRSVSVEQQQQPEPGLYRTISRATLIDQETGSVYQVIQLSLHWTLTGTVLSAAREQTAPAPLPPSQEHQGTPASQADQQPGQH